MQYISIVKRNPTANDSPKEIPGDIYSRVMVMRKVLLNRMYQLLTPILSGLRVIRGGSAFDIEMVQYTDQRDRIQCETAHHGFREYDNIQ